jgi:uncharacterized membrane protein YheB (UPF0754 family)
MVGEQIISSVPDVPWRLLLIPLITGMIGYITNWVAIRFLFKPIDFVGITVPGLKAIAPSLPRKAKQIPGIMQGKVGWQGIIPSRSGKMGSIAAEKGIAKIATQREFYECFDPERIAQHMVNNSKQEVRELTDEILTEEYSELWQNTPPQVRELIHQRIESQLPRIAEKITEQIGDNIDELLDVNMMITDYLEEHPELVNRLFLEVGDRELNFVINSGFYIGTFLGTFSIPLFIYIDKWWVLPVCGVAVGYLTNWIALKLIFLPIEERTFGPFRLQGLFIKRQPTAAEKYAEIVAAEVVTIENVADNLLEGRQSDRTRTMIRDAIRPEVDRAVGIARPIIRMTSENHQYERVRDTFAEESIDTTMDPLRDPEFNKERSEPIEELMRERIKELPPEGFVELLRPAFEEDEWMLILLGAVLGWVAGWIQLLVVTGI